MGASRRALFAVKTMARSLSAQTADYLASSSGLKKISAGCEGLCGEKQALRCPSVFIGGFV
ncbi:hypothetical protein [Pseudomonas sp. Irchel 3E20]|uniref:hypothetical protein n=1 Tax=Pseudomonas sp. Irchel 3E20 TaxID=2008983 RepID=UPI0011403013|nr:hypothetical protein [Pseudomonas sp. Irchel 3E20]